MKILVVDDSTTMRRIICNSLKGAGFTELTEAGDGNEALKSIEECPVDIVLTDWNMPGMDGLTLVKALRASPATSQVPIIMITTEGARDEVMQALAAGVNDYIVKPFTRDILAAKVKEITGA
jgi:two-component system, chemotaxis family, chemotaxis protein CheY